MPEDRAASMSLPGKIRAALEARVRAALAARRGLGRLTAAGLPAMMAVGGILPIMTAGGQASPAALPSRILCSGWSPCNAHGYDSYGYGARGAQAYWRMSPGDQCTNYAAFVESAVYHVATPSYLLGNGGQWAYTAAAHGVPVNHTPSVGAVAEWDGGTFGMGSFGHVGVVEAVGPNDSYIVISQQHMGGLNGYNWTLIKAHQTAGAWQEWPSHFIHFRIPRRAGVGFFNQRAATFGLRDSLTSGPASRTGHLGFHGVVPLIGDWRGDGRDAMGYYDARYATFHLVGAGAHGATIKARFGPPHMIPLVGDWRGRGWDGIGFYDPATGTFYLRQSQRYGPADVKFTFGPPHMIPIAGDWNGDGKDGVGYYNPATGIFNLRNTLSHGHYAVSFHFGPPHMIPIVGNWTGLDKHDGVGYYNPWAGTFRLRDRAVKGPVDAFIRFGPPHMIPLAGEWVGS